MLKQREDGGKWKDDVRNMMELRLQEKIHKALLNYEVILPFLLTTFKSFSCAAHSQLNHILGINIELFFIIHFSYILK